jgi:LytS/YehU family sensor histidine kinase
MNPHFIFNCVNGIQYFVLANKMDEVLAYLSDFSKVVGESLANATQRMVPLAQEISFLHSYLRLEGMRFPDLFDYEILCCAGEDADTLMVPPMLVQPFAENAIRHGFASMPEKGHLSIVYEKAGIDVLKCTITDNGIGREKGGKREASPHENDRPHSASITESRIRLFNSPEEPDKFKIVYTDLFEEGRSCGLRVEVFMPVVSEEGTERRRD